MPSVEQVALGHPTTRLDDRIMDARVAEYKAVLRAGKLIDDGLRRSGKTTAISEVIHEDFGGDALVGFPRHEIAGMFRDHYRREYPKDKIPRTFVFNNRQSIDIALQGCRRYDNIFVDVLNRAGWEMVDWLKVCLPPNVPLKGAW